MKDNSIHDYIMKSASTKKYADIEPACPMAGTTAPEGKSTEPGPFKYRFGSNEVKDAEVKTGVTVKCAHQQQDTNMGEMENLTPPQGSKGEKGWGEEGR